MRTHKHNTTEQTHPHTHIPESLQLSWQVQLQQLCVFLHMCFTWKIKLQYITQVSRNKGKSKRPLLQFTVLFFHLRATVWRMCTYLSMVPNSHLGSLLKGITIWWNRANLVAISAEMSGSESCSVRIRVFWRTRDNHRRLQTYNTFQI